MALLQLESPYVMSRPSRRGSRCLQRVSVLLPMHFWSLASVKILEVQAYPLPNPLYIDM